MRLILTLTGGASVPEKDKIKTLSTGSISIGRAAGNDWVLPDPDRSLSKTHCTITERNGRFILVDSSTNGIFINGASQATERDSQTVLNQGDKLALGDYTIVVTAIDDGSMSASDDLNMDYRPVMPSAPSYGGLGGSVTPQGPLDVDPLDDPFGRGAGGGFQNAGFQHPVAPVAVQPRGLDPFDQVQSRGGLSGGMGSDDDLFRGIHANNEWQGASRPDHTPVISQAVPAMRIASAPLSGDIDFDALIGDLPGAQGGFRPVQGGADPFGGGLAAAPSAAPSVAGGFGGGMQMPGFPPGAGFQQAGPPPGFSAADLMADLAQPTQPDPFAALTAASLAPNPAAPIAVPSVMPPPMPAQSPPPPVMSPALPTMPEVPQGIPLQPAMAQPPRPPAFTPQAPVATPQHTAAETPPAYQPPSEVSRNPFDETANIAPHQADEAEADPMAVTTRQPPAPTPAAVAAPTARPQGAMPPQAAQTAGPDAHAAFRAFLEGAGAAGAAMIDQSNPEAALRAAGEVFRAMAEGLREVLISRAAIKSEMRIEQTMIAAHGNNALKFSVTAEDAVAAMLTSKRRGYMAPLAAAREAVDDIKEHEIAVMAGVQTALMTLLRRFDPDELEKRLSLGGLSAVLPGARKSRYWDSFRQIYGDITREAEDDFQAVFGRQFAKAYTEQTRKE